MSLTARNSPQLFRCSFSRRKKFHTKRLRGKAAETVAEMVEGVKSSQQHLDARWWKIGDFKGKVQLKQTHYLLKTIQHSLEAKGVPHSTCWGLNNHSFVGDLWLRVTSYWDSPEDLKRSQHCGYHVSNRVTLGHRGERDLDRPGKTQDHVFEDGAVVISLNTDETRSGSLYTVCVRVCVCAHTLPCVDTRSLLWGRCSLQRQSQRVPSPCVGPRWGCTGNWSWRTRSAGRKTYRHLHDLALHQHIGDNREQSWKILV